MIILAIIDAISTTKTTVFSADSIFYAECDLRKWGHSLKIIGIDSITLYTAVSTCYHTALQCGSFLHALRAEYFTMTSAVACNKPRHKSRWKQLRNSFTN
jgi:hypothetical protein